jgi:hypothetical protein
MDTVRKCLDTEKCFECDLMILDGEQDKSFLVLDEERFLFLFDFGVLLVLLSRFIDGVLLAGRDGGVLFPSSSACELLFEARDRVVVFADVHL